MSNEITKKDIWKTILIIGFVFVVIPLALYVFSEARAVEIHKENIALLNEVYVESSDAVTDLWSIIQLENFALKVTDNNGSYQFHPYRGVATYPEVHAAAKVFEEISQNAFDDIDGLGYGSSCSLYFDAGDDLIQVANDYYRIDPAYGDAVMHRVPDYANVGSVHAERIGRRSSISILIQNEPKAVADCTLQKSDY